MLEPAAYLPQSVMLVQNRQRTSLNLTQAFGVLKSMINNSSHPSRNHSYSVTHSGKNVFCKTYLTHMYYIVQE